MDDYELRRLKREEAYKKLPEILEGAEASGVSDVTFDKAWNRGIQKAMERERKKRSNEER